MVWLTFLMVIGAFLQTAGVSTILSVVELVMDREKLYKEGMLHDLFMLVGDGSEVRFTVLAMLALILVFVVKNSFLYFQQKATLAFVYTNQFRTSERMMKNYLRRGY